MTTMRKTLASTAILLLLAGGATAGQKPDLPKQIKDMDCLVGKWKGDFVVTMGDAKAKAKATWDCKRTSGDFGVICQLEMTGIPGVSVYRETDLFGYDAGANKYHWFSVTNAGETHDHVADVPAGNTLAFAYEGTWEGKPYRETIRMEFAENGKSFRLRSEASQDGQVVAVFDGTAKK